MIKSKSVVSLVGLMSFLLSLFLWASFFTVNAVADELKEFQHDGKVLLVETTNQNTISISIPYAKTVSVVYENINLKQLPSEALAPNLANLDTKIKETKSFLQLSHKHTEVRIHKSPFVIQFLYKNEIKTQEESGFFSLDTTRGFRFSLNPEEHLYGGGQRVLGMNRRGHKMPLYNRAHYGYTTESNQMYYSLPAVMSSNHYAIIFDNSAKGQLDIGHTESNVLQFSAVGGRTAYIVVMSDNQSELVKTLVSATGRQPLPPRWALGNFASRFGYRNEQQTREVVATFQQEGIPLDAIVLDLYWFGKDVKGHMGALTWDREAFPNPEEMLADFKDQNVKSVLITEPFILSTSSQFTPAVDHSALAKNHNGKPKLFDFYFGNTGLVDVFNEKSKQWFWSYYATLLKQGVAGWWGDLGEPEVHPDDSLHNWNGITVTGDEIHNIYGHKWAEMVYQNTLKAKSNYRPFVLMRSGFIGSQRYGMIPWTGDVSRSWGGLKPQVELALQMSIFGLAYTHSDLGGFAGGEVFDPDLYLRWLNMGVFSPVFRPHGQENIPSEPIFHPESVKSVAKQLIELRYAMLPYNYSLVYENSLTGIPLMRPVSFVDSDPKWFDNHDSYLWGDTLLVSPITEPNTVIKQVDLPSGVWFDFYSDEKYQGQTLAKVTVNQSTIPVFAKAGGILPMVEGLYNTSDYKGDELIVHVWLDGSVESNSFTMYEDNGNDPNAIGNQEFATIEFTLTHHDGQFTIQTISSGRYPKMPQHRNLHWIFHGLETLPKSVKRDNQIGGVSVLEQYWSDNNRTLHVKDAWKHGEFVVISIDR